MSDSPELFYVGVYCDHIGCEADERGDYLAYDLGHANDCLRRDLNARGWDCTTAGDFCPEHTR